MIAAMGDLLIRNVSKSVLDGLKASARRHKRSLQAEALDLLERSKVAAGDSMSEWLSQVRKPGLRAARGIAAIRQARDQR